MNIPVKTFAGTYEVVIGKGLIKDENAARAYLPQKGKALVVTDSGVPKEYTEMLCRLLPCPSVLVLPCGEENKNIHSYTAILDKLCEGGFTRSDCIVSLGGGVCGDMAGFAASSYMRGIAFHNVPTTLLSQVDSSVGGKTGFDYGGVKNLVGAFYPPKSVLTDTDFLSTLPPRRMADGMAEIIKIAAVCDGALFGLLEKESRERIYGELLCEIISRAVVLKKEIVEADEKESSLRRVLNFGHTVGHALELSESGKGLLHGECVGLGMLAVTSGDVQRKLRDVLCKFSLPIKLPVLPKETELSGILLDKKMSGSLLRVVRCPKIGRFEIVGENASDFIKEAYTGLCGL